ncbi:MAG: alpha/beta hydrolase [Cypionkella sp.]|uniref:alpha/beta hydrolase n=1 Tax=Cypionkella sp. TaxID=2811411 RepID=UPI002AB8A751|nr:alpha/beta hydrolase [Cypionkella sp.]MDZ4309927.1 alpha/beta hydrolase [Cypionkella sp.]
MNIAAEADWPRAQLDADYRARDSCSVAEFEQTIANYLARSKATHDLPHSRRDVVFDAETGLALDLFGTVPGELRPLVIFIHGGYWRALSKEHSAFLAPMLAAHGIACAAPDYRLAPAARMADIVGDTRRALAHLWHHADTLGIDRRRILVTGSSAGGHLAATLLQAGWQAELGLPEQPVAAALPISGLFDLAPVAASHVQDWMQFSPDEIANFSPLRHLPHPIPRLTVVAAERETPGFHRQSAAYAKALGVPYLLGAGRHHFDVVFDLADADHPLGQALLRLARG